MSTRSVLCLAAVCVFACVAAPSALGQTVPPSISYQGKLTNSSGQPVSDGDYQVQFKLYDVLSGGIPIWTGAPQTVSTVAGVFTAAVQGGAPAFGPSVLSGGTDVWLETTVGTDVLSPRVKLLAVPYALVSGSSASAGWSLSGNAGTDPLTNFIGTIDNMALEIKVNNTRALRIEPNATSPNLIGGFSGNSADPGVYGATIGGGGAAGYPYDPNVVSGYFGTVGGGVSNTGSGLYATVSGGRNNTASDYSATVSGGIDNTASGKYATVSGGSDNTASGDYSFAAGSFAKAVTNGSFVWADSTYADFTSTRDRQFLIRAAGGVGIGTNDPQATLEVRTSAASGNAIRFGQAGAGRTGNLIAGLARVSIATDDLTERLSILQGSGKVGIGTTAPGSALDVAGGVRARGGVPGGFGANNNGYAFSGNSGDSDSGMFSLADGHVGFYTNNTERMTLDAAGNAGIGTTSPSEKLHVVGNIRVSGSVFASCGTLTCSDARYKTNVEAVEGALAVVERLRPVRFDWKSGEFPENQFSEDRQVGLIAQEVKKVAPEVVQEGRDGYLAIDYARLTPFLVQAIKEQQTTIDAQQKQITDLQKRMAELEKMVNSLAKAK